MQTEIVPLAPKPRYRVCWREPGSWEWQQREFGTDQRAADIQLARLIAAAPDTHTSLVECADELEAAIRTRYEGLLGYPHNQAKLERDLEPVTRARAALKKARGGQ